MKGLNKREFVKWLRANADKQFDRRSPVSCPLATFLQQRNGELWTVNSHEAARHCGDGYYSGERVSYDLPQWAMSFITTWDGQLSSGGKGAGEEALDYFTSKGAKS